MTVRSELLHGDSTADRGLPDDPGALAVVRRRFRWSLVALGSGASAVGVGLVLLSATMPAAAWLPIAVLVVGVLAVGAGIATIMLVPRWSDWIAAPVSRSDKRKPKNMATK